MGRERDSNDAFPLMLAERGLLCEVAEVTGGEGLRRRLADMGLLSGVPLRVEASGHPGPFVVCVKGSRLILGRGMLHHIRVRPLKMRDTMKECSHDR